MGGGSSLQYGLGSVMPFALQSTLTAPTGAWVAQQLAQGRVAGKHAVVTGVSPGGIGFYVASALANHAGMSLCLCGRNEEKNAEAARLIRMEAAQLGKPEPDLHLVPLDLDSLASVNNAAHIVLQHLEAHKGGQLQLLINNAGELSRGYEKTSEGVEANVGRNYLATHHFTELLLPALRKAGAAAQQAARSGSHPHFPRVIHVSSVSHVYSQDVDPKLLLQDPATGGSSEAIVRSEGGDASFRGGQLYSSIGAYGRSKFMLISDARHLAAKERDNGIRVLCLHPGSVASNFASHVGLRRHTYTYGTYLMQYSPAQGAGVVLLAALSPEFDDAASAGGRGAFLHATGAEWQPMQPKDGWQEGRYSSELYDAASQLCGRLAQ